MKTFITTIALVFTLASFQNKGDFDNIVNALKQGNAAQFSNHFDEFIDLKLPEKEEIKNIGKTQATITMKSFFSDNGIKGFDPTSQREMNGTMYLTGKLQGGTKNFNLTLLMKVKGDKLSIISTRIN